ncbi:MAG TPA: hypothetical protein DCK95_05505 [Anaerolineaceae bacterium]|nr:hypothetical protein [Anaerolineaceae bacterium]
MTRQQKITLWVLIVVALVYFIIMIFPNSSSSEGGSVFSIFSDDEFITYPYVEKMLRGGSDIHETWGNLIIYGDYHYGYPFYFISMLVLLPRRLIMGDAFFADRTTNIVILRQMVNVVPFLLSTGILVYYKTKFRSTLKSIFLFILILIIPSAVRSNIWWWHPDSLTFLFIALTFLFLQKDEYRLGKYFSWAAVACGMAVATKLLGLFFFLTIPLYMLIARTKMDFAWKKILKKAFLFVLIMFVVVVLVNPFMWYEIPRNEMLEIQRFKQVELQEGYTHDDPYYYQKGPAFWEWTLSTWFGSPVFICFLMVSMLVGIVSTKGFNENIYLASWVIPFTLYALFLVAPKPDHYIYPALVPAYLTALDIPDYILQRWKTLPTLQKYVAGLLIIAVAFLLCQQVVFSLTADISLYQQYLVQNM